MIMILGVLPSASAAGKIKPSPGVFQEMTYDVYSSGMRVVAADLKVDYSHKGRYTAALSANTQGFLGKIVRWTGVFDTTGWVDAKTGALQPERHRSTTQEWDENEIKTYNYARNGDFKSYTVKNEKDPGTSRPIDPVLTKDTIDALSVTLAVMENVGKGYKCEGSDEVFDGARRYRLIFKPQKDEILKASALNVYGGPAAQCTVEVEPIAGRWHTKPRGWMSIQEQGRESGTMPTIWLAQITEGAPAVPVKIRVKTGFGTLFMHLTSYKSGDNTLTLKK